MWGRMGCCDNSYFCWTAGDWGGGAGFEGTFSQWDVSAEGASLAPAECQSASTGHRQTVVSFSRGPIQSDRDEAGAPPPRRAKLQSPAEVKAHRSMLSKSSLLLPIWRDSCGRSEELAGAAFLKTSHSTALTGPTTLFTHFHTSECTEFKQVSSCRGALNNYMYTEPLIIL